MQYLYNLNCLGMDFCRRISYFIIFMDLFSFYSALPETKFITSCPVNKQDWDTASRRLGCSNDSGLYHCLPIENYSLVELCFYAVAAQQKGILS